MKEWDTVVDFEEYVKALQRDAEAPLATASTYGVRAVAGTLSRLKDKVRPRPPHGTPAHPLARTPSEILFELSQAHRSRGFSPAGLTMQ